MAGETEDEIPESGAIFTFGKSKFADNVPRKFWFKNDKPLRIFCGDEHTALITDNGKLYMFGSNNCGQLGLGTKTTVKRPTSVKALKTEKVKLAACGRNHTLVYTTSRNVYAAGGNRQGQLGLGDRKGRTSFQLLPFFSGQGPIKMLAAGSSTSAVLTEKGRLYMWGDNTEGQIGMGDGSHVLSPQEVTVGGPVCWVSCGYCHSAFITVNGELYTCGEFDGGRLGLPPEQWDNHRIPQMVQGIPDKVTQVACGGAHTIAISGENVYSFGMGQFGQLGLGTFIFQCHLPKLVDHFQKGRVTHVMCGENHNAIITDTGLLYTFGDGRHGKLGLGEENFTNQFKPTLCPHFLKYFVQSVSCGGYNMLVLAKLRSKYSREVSLEDQDVTEDYLGKSVSELQGDHLTYPLLHKSLSARARRREREQSAEQFGLMIRTVHHMKSGFQNISDYCPPKPPKEPADMGHQYSLKKMTSSKAEKIKCDHPDGVKDNDYVRKVNGITDVTNITQARKMLEGAGSKTLILSPVRKKMKNVKGVKTHDKTLEGGFGPPRGKQAPAAGESDFTPGQTLLSEQQWSTGPATHKTWFKNSSKQRRFRKGASGSQENIFVARKLIQPESPKVDACELEDGIHFLSSEDSDGLLKPRKPTEVKIKQVKDKSSHLRGQKQMTYNGKPGKTKQSSVNTKSKTAVQGVMTKVRSIPERVQSIEVEKASTPLQVKSRTMEVESKQVELKSAPKKGKGALKEMNEEQTAVENTEAERDKNIKTKSIKAKNKPTATQSDLSNRTHAPKRKSGFKSTKDSSSNKKNTLLVSSAANNMSPTRLNLVTEMSQTEGEKKYNDKNKRQYTWKGPDIVSEFAKRQLEKKERQEQGQTNILRDVVSYLPDTAGPVCSLTEMLSRQVESKESFKRVHVTSPRLSKSDMGSPDPFQSESEISALPRTEKRTTVCINTLPEGNTYEQEGEPDIFSHDQGTKQDNSESESSGGHSTNEEIKEDSGEAEDSSVAETETKSSDDEDAEDGTKSRIHRAGVRLNHQEESEDSMREEGRRKDYETDDLEDEEESQSDAKKREMLEGLSEDEDQDGTGQEQEESEDEKEDKNYGKGYEKDESDVEEEEEGDEDEEQESSGEEVGEDKEEESSGEEEKDETDTEAESGVEEEESNDEEEEEKEAVEEEESSYQGQEEEEEDKESDEEEGEKHEIVDSDEEEGDVDDKEESISAVSGEEEKEDDSNETEESEDNSEEEENEEEEGESSDAGEQNHENESEREEEEDEEMEEEEKKKKGSVGEKNQSESGQKSRAATQNRAGNTYLSRSQARKKEASAHNGLQESQKFWNNVLPQYLNLK